MGPESINFVRRLKKKHLTFQVKRFEFDGI